MSYTTQNTTSMVDRVEAFPDDAKTMLLNRVSWGAIFAGLAVAVVLTILLNVLGIGIGLSALDATNGQNNPNASSFSINAAIWWTVSGIVASFLGGLVAGRLYGAHRSSTGGWHGIVVWSCTTLLLFYMLTTGLAGIVGGTFSAIGSAVGGLGSAVTSAAPGLAQAADPAGGLTNQVRNLVNPNDTQNVQQNVTDYIRAGVQGDAAAQQAAKDRAVNSVAAAAHISPDEARTKLDQLQQQYNQATDKAKQAATQAAEAARSTTSQAAIFGFVALMIGAVAAFLGGAAGTPRRATTVVAPGASRI